MVALPDKLRVILADFLYLEGIYAAVGAGLVLGFVAQSGDLLESAVKRRAGVKDSGTIIPGHGGLLDRFDGYLLVLPVSSRLYQLTLDIRYQHGQTNYRFGRDWINRSKYIALVRQFPEQFQIYGLCRGRTRRRWRPWHANLDRALLALVIPRNLPTCEIFLAIRVLKWWRRQRLCADCSNYCRFGDCRRQRSCRLAGSDGGG